MLNVCAGYLGADEPESGSTGVLVGSTKRSLRRRSLSSHRPSRSTNTSSMSATSNGTAAWGGAPFSAKRSIRAVVVTRSGVTSCSRRFVHMCLAALRPNCARFRYASRIASRPTLCPWPSHTYSPSGVKRSATDSGSPRSTRYANSARTSPSWPRRYARFVHSGSLTMSLYFSDLNMKQHCHVPPAKNLRRARPT